MFQFDDWKQEIYLIHLELLMGFQGRDVGIKVELVGVAEEEGMGAWVLFAAEEIGEKNRSS